MGNLSNAVYKSSKNYSDADKSLGRNMMRSAMQAPYLERQKEHDLALRWKDKRDDDAMHQIAAAHMRLVIAIANRFKRFKMPLGDLVQEGYVGLLKQLHVLNLIGKCVFQRMQRGGYVLLFKIIFCEIGQLFEGELVLHKKHFSLIFGVCVQN